MKLRLGIFWMLVWACICASARANATALAPVGTDVEVRIESLDYDIEVRGVHVAATMEVRFWSAVGNATTANLHFPLPPGAVIHHAQIYLPDQERWEVAETMGRREGQDAYESAASTGENRLLVQQIGLGLYRARVYPVDAGSRLVLRLRYAHVLETDGEDEIVRIAHAGPDESPAIPDNGLHIRVHAGEGLWSVGSFSGLGGSFDAGAGEGRIDLYGWALDEDVVLRLRRAGGAVPFRALRYVPRATELDVHTHVAWRPHFVDNPELQAQPRSVVFVIDRSGSMSEGRKMPETRTAVTHALTQLAPADEFGIVAFDQDTSVFRSAMAGVSYAGEAMDWVADIEPGGSTGMAGALVRAVELGATSSHPSRPLDLILVTDGRPNDGPSTPETMVELIQGGLAGRQVRVFGCGIGYDLDQQLINAMSHLTGGVATFALSDAAITGEIAQLFHLARGGGLGDVTLSIGGAEEIASLWRVFPGELLLGGTVAPNATHVELRGTTMEGALFEVAAALTLPATPNPAFARIAAPLAANAWSDELIRWMDQNAETPAALDEAIVLAKTYGIVTRYTSLIALASPEAYVDRGIQRVERDVAGIALEPITTSSEDEARIGGDGVEDSSSAGSPSSDPASATENTTGCGCSLPGDRTPRHAWLWLLMGCALLRRRR